MGRGIKLTEYEKGQIDQLRSLQWSNRRISEELNRSKNTINNYVNSGTEYGSKSSFGRPKIAGKKVMKKIIRLASNKCISSSRIKGILALKCTTRTVRNYFNNVGKLKYMKMKGKPPLTKEHKLKRLEMAYNCVRWTQEWHNVIFSDEKKFNLDGPDGLFKYWHCLDSEKINFSKRVQGGGSLMIWVGFCYWSKTPVIFINTTMNSQGYINLLRQHLIPFANANYNIDYIFQQDNAPCHRAQKTQDWLEEKGINTFDWPAHSPDLNPVENLFGMLAMFVYQDGKQYNTVEDLKNGILGAWDKIQPEMLCKLIDSMPERMIMLLKSNGGSIKY